MYNPKRIYSSYDPTSDFEDELEGEREIKFYQLMKGDLTYDYCLESGCEPYIKSETSDRIKIDTERYPIG